MGLLLGWHQPAAGEVLIDCEALDAGRLVDLRHETAWVDPSIQLWNRPLISNLRYGSLGDADRRIGGAIETAMLRDLLEKLPQCPNTQTVGCYPRLHRISSWLGNTKCDHSPYLEGKNVALAGPDLQGGWKTPP